MSKINIRLLNWSAAAILCLLSFSTFGQITLDGDPPKTNSPYSLIALGDLAQQNYIHSIGMGGLGASFNDPYMVNLVNPASIGFLRATAFEIGGFARFANLDTGSTELNTYAGNFSYMSLGFPIKNQVNIELDRRPPLVDWKMNFSLTPFSTVGYNIDSKIPVEGSNMDSLSTQFTGKGGTYKVAMTNAVEYKNLSVGLDLGYFFGNIISETTAQFDSLSNSYLTSLISEESYSGFVWKLGALYNYHFDTGEDEPVRKLSLGAYVSNQANTVTKSSQFYRRFSTVFSQLDPNALDTILNTSGVRGQIVLPREYGIGLTYEKVGNYRVGIDYSASQWGNYTQNGESAGLRNTYRIAAGGEFIPNSNSYNRYWKRIRYKAGVYYTQDPRSDNLNEQLTETGVTIGLTLPVVLARGQKSWCNLAVTGGKFGTEGSLNETFVRINLGFTLNDNLWFYKRKFN